jgi:hypothetical protein
VQFPGGYIAEIHARQSGPSADTVRH